jgi:hypothetical protein
MNVNKMFNNFQRILLRKIKNSFPTIYIGNRPKDSRWIMEGIINPLMPELNPSTQRCLTRFFTGDFASGTVHFINTCVKNQQMQQLFIQFINYVW